LCFFVDDTEFRTSNPVRKTSSLREARIVILISLAPFGLGFQSGIE